jgi:subtilisin family serine protease
MTEVVVTLHAPAMAAFGRSLTSARTGSYTRELDAAQNQAMRNVRAAIPGAVIRWRYRIVADGFSVYLPAKDVPRLARVAGIAEVWPSVTYHALATTADLSPETIKADRLWGAGLATSGQGIKIGIIDDGVDAQHRYFDPTGFSYPPGFPRGQVRYATPKVIVQRAFAPPGETWRYASVPFDPKNSFHGTHVAGIAAGDHGVSDGTLSLTGVAPGAYIGNYKALTVPTPDFGLDGNSAELTAAIEAAVSDGMNVINLSLGEPEVEPSRDIVVHAIDAAAAAGVVPVVAAGNDFGQYRYGSISSPGNAPDAITVAATDQNEIASFSSAGPTPISLQFKPDVSAPGVGIISSLPLDQGGPWGELEGTSMATPQVAGGVALLRQQHPDWSVEQIKSALVQTADRVLLPSGTEAPATREGGGLIDLVRANDPLFFARPTSIAFPVNGGSTPVALTDAGGGAGIWSVKVEPQRRVAGVTVSAASSVTVPGRLVVTAQVGPRAPTGDVTGFVYLSRGDDQRRIPYWLEVSRPKLASEPHYTLTAPGTYQGSTANGLSLVDHYRYPTGGRTTPGPEVVYRVRITKRVANFGVAVTSGKAIPYVVYSGDEDHLAGYAGLPQGINPYIGTFDEYRPIAGAVLPLPGVYDVVFDTRSKASAGPFTFRFWVNDTTPPRLALLPSPPGQIWVSAVDNGAGVDPESVTATLDGKSIPARYSDDRIVINATAGLHRLVLTVSDYQEAKNMEDVVRITPNTSTLARTVRVG